MNKQFKSIEVSNVTLKDIDSKEGIVTGYYSVFGNIDSDGDMIMPGAFLKTIQDNGPEGKNRIMHLWQHNPNEPIGKPSVLKEDTYGLYFETKLADTSRGKDTLKLYEAGVINEHSIGFNTVKKESKSDHTALLELKLWEGSTVTWGANDLTRVTGMKSLNKEGVFSLRENLYKAIKSGTYTDETFLLLIEQLEALDNELKSLIQATTQPEVIEPTIEPEYNEKELITIIQITKEKSITR
jgi:HK97 family phage prohead protease